jgi:hypothetical protein
MQKLLAHNVDLPAAYSQKREKKIQVRNQDVPSCSSEPIELEIIHLWLRCLSLHRSRMASITDQRYESALMWHMLSCSKSVHYDRRNR